VDRFLIADQATKWERSTVSGYGDVTPMWWYAPKLKRATYRSATSSVA